MRKLLLATVAVLSASMGATSCADAQIVDDTDGQSFPSPGQVTVRLNGLFRFYVGEVNNGSSSHTVAANPASAASTSASTVATNSTSAGINKEANYGFINFLRLYPGFDGVAANGLKYGASVEFRQDNNYGAGGGVFGSTSGQNGKQGLFWIRREWGYIGTDRLGVLRLGASDQPGSLYLTGNFETFNSGGLDGSVPAFLNSVNQINFPFADQGALYSTNKAVYLSPQFYGFDGGVSFEPSTAAVGGDANNCGATAGPGQFIASGPAVASVGCNFLSSTSTNDVQRRRNTYEALIRYRGTFGPVGIAATASYDGSGRVQDSGVAGSTTNPRHYRLEDLSVGDFGLVLTYGGFSVGGNYQYGRYNTLAGGASALIARGQPNASAFIAGATYTIGPVIVGAHYLRSFSEGDQQTATNRTIFGGLAGGTRGGQRMEQGLASGATYSVAPGISIYLDQIWEARRQAGYNFLSGQSNNPLNNKVVGTVYAVGTSFAW